MEEAAGGNRLCRLEKAVGRHATCPGDACGLWEPGDAIREGQCVLDGIDFVREPGLADWLLELRATIESARADRSSPGHELRRVLSDGRE